MNPRPSFFAELQRRHVYKVGAMYAVAGWLLVQVVTQVLPVFDVPALGQRVLVLIVAAGFPVALVLAWVFDITPQGIVRTEAQATADAPTPATRHRTLDRRLNYVLGLLLLLAAGYFAAERVGTFTRPAPAAETAAGDKSIAVLPFENLSRDPDNAYFADGIQDEILTRLAKIGALKVISRTSTQQYAAKPGNLSEIARQLGVANILEGSVQKIGDAVHINVQLIRAATDDHLWAESYNRKLDDVFGVEGEVAQTIAETLKARLTGAEAQQIAARPTVNPAAYDAYLRGLAFSRRADALGPNILNAIAAYQLAVQLDPGFALAWAGLSGEHSFAYIYEDPSESHRNAAREAADTATRLAPEATETRIAQGFYRYWVERDYESAKTIFESVRQQTPNNSWASYALAAIARRQGRWSDSRSLFDQAVPLDPQNILLLVDAAGTDLAMRDVAPAQQLLDRALVIAPDNPGVLVTQAGALQEIGAIDQAQAVLDRAHVGQGDDNLVFTAATNAALSRRFGPAIALLQSQLAHPESLGNSLAPYEAALGDLQRLAGDGAAAKASYTRALADVQAALKAEPDNARFVAALSTIEAGLGNRNAALEHARQAIALLPAAKDALVGPGYEENLARLQARFGDRDAALAALHHLIAISYGWPPVTPAMMRLDPDWDNLRGDPRFDQLLADAAAAMEAQSRN